MTLERHTRGGITRYLSQKPSAGAETPGKADKPSGPMKISAAFRAAAKGGHKAGKRPHQDISPFTPASHPPEIEKAVGGDLMAMDNALTSWGNSSLSQAFGVSDWMASVFAEGQAFLGYPYLAMLTQRPEYRRMAERIAAEMTRKWIKFRVTGDDKSLEDRIKELETEMKRLRVRALFRKAAEFDLFMGRSHLVPDFGTGAGLTASEFETEISEDPEVLKNKIGRNTLKRLSFVEPVWLYPVNYNTSDPLDPWFYRPRAWSMFGRTIHASRVLTFIGREVPDLLKPAYSFGGLSLTQMAKPYVDNWLRTRQAVTDLVESFSVSGLMTDMSTIMQGGSGDDVLGRVDTFNDMRSNRGTMVLNKDTEEFFNISTPLGGLGDLQAQAMEQMSVVSGIPLSILLAVTPKGLNASSEGEIKIFEAFVNAYQVLLYAPNLDRLLPMIMLSLWGRIIPEITYEFEPLGGMSEKEKAEIRKTDVDADVALVGAGILATEEIRTRIANAEESPYSGIDPTDVPEATPEEEADLNGLGDEPDDDLDPDGGEEGDTRAADSDFSEADHPRAPDGKFGQGSGSGIKSTPTKELSSFRKSTIKSLTEHGLKTGTEALAMFDLKANRPVEGGGAESSDKHVAMTPEMMEKLRDGAVAYEVHHNHPGGGSLSGMDLAMVAHYPGIKRLYAHGDDGSSFAVAGVPRDVSDRAGQVHRLSERLLGRQAALSAGDRDLLKSHLANLALQNTGWVRDYEAHLSPKMESLTKTAIAKGVLAKLIDNNKPFARKAAGMATDAWEESSHPRDAGRFSSKPGSKGQKAAAASSTAPEAGKPAPSGADAPKGLGKVVGVDEED